MSKYNLEVPFTAFSGKVCKHSKIIFKKVRQTNFTSQICNPRDLTQKPYKPAEIATHDKFRRARAAVMALTPEQIAAYETAFVKQTKYSYLQGYIFAQEYTKLNP